MLATARLAGRMKSEVAHGRVAITLVNAADIFVERLRLHQLAANRPIGQRPIASILQGARVTFVRGTITRIDIARRCVDVQTDSGVQSQEYDYLIYALGVAPRGLCGVRDPRDRQPGQAARPLNAQLGLDHQLELVPALALPIDLELKRVPAGVVDARAERTKRMALWQTERFAWAQPLLRELKDLGCQLAVGLHVTARHLDHMIRVTVPRSRSATSNAPSSAVSKPIGRPQPLDQSLVSAGAGSRRRTRTIRRP